MAYRGCESKSELLFSESNGLISFSPPLPLFFAVPHHTEAHGKGLCRLLHHNTRICNYIRHGERVWDNALRRTGETMTT